MSMAADHLRRAVELARATIQLARKPSGDSYNLGVYLAAEGKFDQAREELLGALERCPNSWWALEAIDDLQDLAIVPGVDHAQVGELVKLLERSGTINEPPSPATEPSG
jgi:hypothetical protein